MFGVKENPCIGFDSKWKVKKVLTNSVSQTTEYSVSHVETNTATSIEIQVQTENSTNNSAAVDVDMQKLSDWLKKIYPQVKDQIDDVNNCKIFKNYNLIGEDVVKKCKLIQTLKIFSHVHGESLKVNGLSWNSTGQTLAITGSFEHDSWCYHTGILMLYTFDREGLLPEVPNKKLTTGSCITDIRFHPILPYVISVGTHAGDIVIWSIQRDDNENILAKVSSAHEGTVTQISWIHDVDLSRTLLFASSGLDGFLNLWNFDEISSLLTMKKRYKIKSSIFAHTKRTSSDEFTDKVIRGIICFDFSKFLPDIFVVGAEGGLVVQCSLSRTNDLKGSSPELPVLNPVYKYYEPHEGDIVNISFSPNRKEMYMTNASDGEIRVYLLEQEEPAQIIHLEISLNCCTWIPYVEKLVVGCGNKGFIEIFHVREGRAVEDVTDELRQACTFTLMEINNKRTSLVSVGTSEGTVQLWNCPWELF